jgi:Fe-S cluster assembly protein SufD
MDGLMTSLANIWQADNLYDLSNKTPFKGATKHWQDKALACFIEAGYPSRRIEAWRYTDLTNLLKQDFSITQEKKAQPIDLKPYTIANSYRLVFVNGVLDLDQSDLADEVIVLPLDELLNTADETLLRELRIELDLPYFACLNSALMRQGCYIKVRSNQTLDKPVHILHLTTAEQKDQMQTLRFFIDADKNSEVIILEEHVGVGKNCYFNNIVTQMNLNFDARVSYYKFQRDAEQAYHFATTIVSQSADSQFSYYIVADGAKQNREDLFVRHYERGSHANLVGFYNAKNERQTIHHSRVDHFKGMCSTYQSYKGMARDTSKAVFSGKMIVHPGAQKSSIQQSNHN